MRGSWREAADFRNAMFPTAFLGSSAPFFHEFEPLSSLTPAQRSVVEQKGGA
jgi:hypothetical protein